MIAVNLNSKVLNPATPEPTPAKPVSVAFLFGASDAEAKENCTPEMFFLGRESIRQYVRGFLSVNRSPMAVMVAQYYGLEVEL